MDFPDFLEEARSVFGMASLFHSRAEADRQVEEPLQRVMRMKADGNSHFKSCRYVIAKKLYGQTASLMADMSADNPVYLMSRAWLLAGASIASNLAAVCMNSAVYIPALEYVVDAFWYLNDRDQDGRRRLPFACAEDPSAKSLLRKLLERRMYICEQLGNYGWIHSDLLLMERAWGKHHEICVQAKQRHEGALSALNQMMYPNTSCRLPNKADSSQGAHHLAAMMADGIFATTDNYPSWLGTCSAYEASTGSYFYGGGAFPDAETPTVPGSYGLLQFLLLDNLRFRIKKVKWKGKSPSSRRHATLVGHGGKLYLWGGHVPAVCRPAVTSPWGCELADMWIFDLETKKWSVKKNEYKKLASPGPPPLNMHTAVLADTREDPSLYIFGGMPTLRAGFHPPEIWKYSIKEGTWTAILDQRVLDRRKRTSEMSLSPGGEDEFDFFTEDHQRPLAGHASWFWNDRLYVFGGMLATSFDYMREDVVLTSEVWSFDMKTRLWENRKPGGNIPSPRACCGMAQLPGDGSQIVIIGGYIGFAGTVGEILRKEQGVMLSPEVFIYDCRLNQWTQVVCANETVPWMEGRAWACTLNVRNPVEGMATVAVFSGVCVDFDDCMAPMTDMLYLPLKMDWFPSRDRAAHAVHQANMIQDSEDEALRQLESAQRVKGPTAKRTERQDEKENRGGNSQQLPKARPASMEKVKPQERSAKDEAIQNAREESLGQTAVDKLLKLGSIPEGMHVATPPEAFMGPWAAVVQPYDPFKDLGGMAQDVGFFTRLRGGRRNAGPPAVADLGIESCLIVEKHFGTQKAARQYFSFAERFFIPGIIDRNPCADPWLPLLEQLTLLWSSYRVTGLDQDTEGRTSMTLTDVYLLVLNRTFCKLALKIRLPDTPGPDHRTPPGIEAAYREQALGLFLDFLSHLLASAISSGPAISCAGCGATAEALQNGEGSERFKVCGCCKLVRYCSMACQKKARRSHLRLCKAGGCAAPTPRPGLPPHSGSVLLVPGGTAAAIEFDRYVDPCTRDGPGVKDYVTDAEGRTCYRPDAMHRLHRSITEQFPWSIPVILRGGEVDKSLMRLENCFYFPRPDNTVGQLLDMLREQLRQRPLISPGDRAGFERILDAVNSYSCGDQVVHSDRTIREVAQILNHPGATEYLRINFFFRTDPDREIWGNSDKTRASTLQKGRAAFASDQDWERA